MKRIIRFTVLVYFLFLCCYSFGDKKAALIIDQSCTKIDQVPLKNINDAKTQLKVGYGHTSHGSQITSGMSGLKSFMTGKGFNADQYGYNNGGSNNALDFRDRVFSGASDLGNPNRTEWAAATRTYLNSHPELNVVIWSWCGQVSNAKESDIETYLSLMNQLEADFPNVKFIYMTGHLDGSGENGNLNQRNEQIRKYCLDNNKILYDFADIESYDPDAQVNYMLKNCNDNCDYDSDNNGSRDANWSKIWQNNHTQNTDWYSCSAAHSQALNGNQKAYAAWWLFARLAGWEGSQGSGISSTKVLKPKISVLRQDNLLSVTVVSEKEIKNIQLYDISGKKLSYRTIISTGKNRIEASYPYNNIKSHPILFCKVQLNDRFQTIPIRP